MKKPSAFFTLLFFVLTGLTTFATAPTIGSFSPVSGPIGQSVTITGTGFNPVSGNNIVFFGAAMATVGTASATSLSVTVPAGASYQYISVTNLANNLTVYSAKPFAVTLAGEIGFDAPDTIQTGANPDAVVIADLDGDGQPDLAVDNQSGTLSVFHNASTPGNVHFVIGATLATTGISNSSIAFGDLDGDGRPDLVVTNLSSVGGLNNVAIFHNTYTVAGTISFASAIYITLGMGINTYPSSVGIADIDGDGKPDVAVMGAGLWIIPNTSSVGNISFGTPVNFPTVGGELAALVIGDFDGDGKPDVAVANGTTDNHLAVLHNASTPGSFSFPTLVTYATGSEPISIAIGDMDGDGKPDLAVANEGSNTISVYHNTSSVGTISFAAQVTFPTCVQPFSVAITDIDGDGKPDLAVANADDFSGGDTVSVFHNLSTSGSISFATQATFMSEGVSNSYVGIGDIDGDGKPDLVVSDYSSSMVSVLLQNVNTWLGFSSDWGTGFNWSYGTPPGQCTDNVVIPSGTANDPVISATAYVGNISFIEGHGVTTITIQANDILDICGNVTTGAGLNSITFNGTTAVDFTGESDTIFGGNLSFQTLIINSGFGTTLWSGATVNIYTALDLVTGVFNAFSGTATLISTADNQTAIINNFSPFYVGTYFGNVTAQRYYGAASQQTDNFSQHMIGSPVGSGTLTAAALGSSSASSAQYLPYTGVVAGTPDPNNQCDEVQGAAGTPYGNVFAFFELFASSCVQSGWQVVASSTVIDGGVGFSVVRGAGAGTLSLTGTPNLATSYSAVTSNAGYSPTTSDQGRSYPAGINLLANPYPAALNASQLASDNSANFSGTVYVWDEASASYQNPAVIAPFQAFKVIRTTSNTIGNYVINGSARTTSTGTYERTTNPIQLTMNVTNNSTGLTDETTVGFNPNATAGFDNAYDLIKLPGALNRHTLYTLNSNNWMWVNILNSISETNAVAIGFEPGVSGTYTANFSGINSFDPTSYVTLEDLQTGTMHDVRSGSYTFTSNGTDNYNRFVLHFTPAASINTTAATCSSDGMINVIQPGTANWNYTITDVNNTTLSTGTLNVNSPVNASVAAGVYTVTLIDANGYTLVKTIQVNGSLPVAASFKPAVSAQVNEEVTFTSNSQNATSNVWNFGDGASANGNTTTHTYTVEGTYNVTLTSGNDAGCTSTVSHTISVTSGSATGIQDLGENAIKIWSFENMVNISLGKASDGATVAIYNVIGQQLVNDKLTGTRTLYSKAIENIEAGYVIVTVKNEVQTVTSKVFIANIK